MRRLGSALLWFVPPLLVGVALAVTGVGLLTGPDERSWFGWTLVVLALACAAIAARTSGRVADALSDVVFGQRDRDSREVNWVPGAGGHGGPGGQTPPYVPYSEDHDPAVQRRGRREVRDRERQRRDDRPTD